MKNNKFNLKVGDKIKIGKQYAEKIGGLKSGEVITLILGHFEYDNGLYCEDQTAPAIWDEEQKDFDSIYHLFGNSLEDFMDCELLLSNGQKDERSVARDDDQGTEAG